MLSAEEHHHHHHHDQSSCDQACVGLLSLFGGLFGFALLCSTVQRLVRKWHQRRARVDPAVFQKDRATLRSALEGQQAAAPLTVACTTVYSGCRLSEGDELTAQCALAVDNSRNARSLSAEGEDAFGRFTISGRFVLDSPTHGHVAFTEAYAKWSASYAGELDAAQQPLSVTGHWYIKHGRWSDAGPFTMTLARHVTVVDTPPAAAVIDVVTDGNAAAEGQVGVEVSRASSVQLSFVEAEPQPSELFVSAHSIERAAAPATLKLEQRAPETCY